MITNLLVTKNAILIQGFLDMSKKWGMASRQIA